MPLYEFACDVDESGCGKETSILCSYDDLPKNPKCEHCDKDKVRRLYGVGMIKTTYEQNGRKAVEIKMDVNKKPTRRSMTRQNVLDGKGTASVLTKGYQEHVTKVERIKKVNREMQLQKQLFGKVLK